jgi:carbon monoxide dehydrogenase subunit G
MGDISASVIIDAAPEVIWDYVEQIERHVEWMADADSIEFEGERRRGIGTSFVCTTKLGPVRLTDHMEITDWQPDRAMTVEHTGVVTGGGSFVIEPVNARSSRFVWSESLSFPWYLGGRLGERLGGTAVLAAIWRHNLRLLKSRVEAGA